MTATTWDGSPHGSSEPNLATAQQRETLRSLGVSAEELEQLWADDGSPEPEVYGAGAGVRCINPRGTDRDWSGHLREHLTAGRALTDAEWRALQGTPEPDGGPVVVAMLIVAVVSFAIGFVVGGCF